MVCKIVFCPKFPDIPGKAGRAIRRRTQAISKRYAFLANAIVAYIILRDFLCLTNMSVKIREVSRKILTLEVSKTSPEKDGRSTSLIKHYNPFS